MMMLSVVFLLAYFVVIMVATHIFSRKTRDLRDFFLAGRSLNAFPVALTLVASWFGAASTMGSINAFHDRGLSGAWQIVIPSITSFILITLFMARPVSRQAHLSQPEAVEASYGRIGRFLLALIILASVTVFIGSQLVVAGKFFQIVAGMDLMTGTLISAAMVMSYSIWGGFFTVVITDIVQIIFLITGFLILLIFTVTHAFPEPAALQQFWTHHPASFWNLFDHWEQNGVLALTFALAWSIAPEMWQRMSSTKNPELAFRAGWQAAIMITCLFAIIITIGLCSTQLVGKDDAVLVKLAMSIPQTPLRLMVLMGFFSAVTSTMDSSLNIGSLTLTRDIYQRFLRSSASQKELIMIGRLTTLLMLIPAVMVALYFQNLMKILWISSDIYASSMFIPMIGMLYLKNPRPLSGICGMVAGSIVVVLSAIFQNHWLPFDIPWPGWPESTLVGIAASAIGFGVGHLLSRQLSLPRKPSIKPLACTLPTLPAWTPEPSRRA